MEKTDRATEPELDAPNHQCPHCDAPRLDTRIALTIQEAANAVGVSKRHLQGLLPEIPHAYLGARIVIPVRPFEEWLRKRAEAPRGHVNDIVEDVLADFKSG